MPSCCSFSWRIQLTRRVVRMRTAAALVVAAVGAAPASASRVGVIVHGFDLGAEDWQHVVWGSPQDGRYGRVPHGLLLARRFKARVVILGSGGTCDEDGISEAEHTRRFALNHVSELSGLPHFSVRAIRQELKKVVLLEQARNTRQELEAAREHFRRHRVDTIVVVSSPTHAPRCLRDASAIFDSGSIDSPTILASPCRTDFGSGGATVVEPQHRSDRPRWLDSQPSLQLNALVSRALQVSNTVDGAFNKDLDKLIKRYEGKRKSKDDDFLPDTGPRRCGCVPRGD